jgi:hypothetical protein
MRLSSRLRVLSTFCLLASVESADAQNAWVLWRHFVPKDNPEDNDPRLWHAEPKSTTKEQCESEVKEYQALDPEKLRLDPNGRAYRIEYQCLSDTIDPRRAKGK